MPLIQALGQTIEQNLLQVATNCSSLDRVFPQWQSGGLKTLTPYFECLSVIGVQEQGKRIFPSNAALSGAGRSRCFNPFLTPKIDVSGMDKPSKMFAEQCDRFAKIYQEIKMHLAIL